MRTLRQQIIHVKTLMKNKRVTPTSYRWLEKELKRLERCLEAQINRGARYVA